jgi:hypothetical protein
MRDRQEFFGEPTSAYTNSQTLGDGAIVDISALGIHFRGRPLNRMTGGLWDDFRPFVEAWSPAHYGNYNSTLRSMLKTKLLRVYHKGGIWQVPPGLWLMENELNGWTIMRPEDY